MGETVNKRVSPGMCKNVQTCGGMYENVQECTENNKNVRKKRRIVQEFTEMLACTKKKITKNDELVSKMTNIY